MGIACQAVTADIDLRLPLKGKALALELSVLPSQALSVVAIVARLKAETAYLSAAQTTTTTTTTTSSSSIATGLPDHGVFCLP